MLLRQGGATHTKISSNSVHLLDRKKEMVAEREMARKDLWPILDGERVSGEAAK
jgi:hypothetical protein